jgi:predicted nuclease with TOPRIM domain
VSNDDRPDLAALEALQRVLDDLTGELSAWRRRALKAEGEREQMGADYDAVANRERILELEGDNEALTKRLDAARTRVNDLIGRLRFLEEQVSMEEQRR